jgi:DNA segregation ATPase FtsK/SpoIIIE-like protein
MIDRPRNGKTFAQDATGFVFCLVGGFFTVSAVQHLMGQEPKESVRTLVQPVIALVTGLGPAGALLFAVGLAVLGALLFLRASALAPMRPFGAILLGSLGMTLLAGTFGVGGTLGALLPDLVGDVAGRAIGAVLGAALAWLAWLVVFQANAPRESTVEALQRIALATRQDPAGVSPAEAALLVNEPRPRAQALPAQKPLPPRREEPLRTETLQPRAPVAPARAEPVTMSTPVPAAPASQTPPTPAWEDAPEPSTRSLRAEEGSLAPEAPSSESPLETLRASRVEVFAGGTAPAAVTPDAQATRDETTGEEAELEAGELARDLADEREDDPFAESEEEELASEEEATSSVAAAEPPLPAAAWEQNGLFDEVEEPAPRAAPHEPAPTFDFEVPAPEAQTAPKRRAKPARAPRALEADADPFAGPPEPEPAAPLPAPVEEFTLKPAEPKPTPVVLRDEVEERWAQLVYDAGCLILEQKRVAVSMLERRFGIDFDRACKVLDELQSAGLIGPYIGGRSRDILLTREEWLPHAPHAP